jgi:2-oxoglutarate ferredoxin oxidoreductase subunit beta
MLDWQQDHTVNINKWDKLSEEEREGKYPTGIIHQEEKVDSEYTSRYQQIIKNLQKEGE